MPRYISKPIGAGGWLTLFFLTGLTLWGMITRPLLLAAAVILLRSFYAVVRPRFFREEQQLLALAALRADDSICEFAKSLIVARSILGLFVQSTNNCRCDSGMYIRLFQCERAIGFKEDLLLDDDDLEMDLIHEIEVRTGRSLKDFSANPTVASSKRLAT